MTKTGYALFIGVRIKTDFHISILCPRDLFCWALLQ